MIFEKFKNGFIAFWNKTLHIQVYWYCVVISIFYCGIFSFVTILIFYSKLTVYLVGEDDDCKSCKSDNACMYAYVF